VNEQDPRPPIWVGHIVLETDVLEQTEQFMRQLGMRPIVHKKEVAILELRGGTHLVLIAKPEVKPREAGFDLMVEDIHATHDALVAKGLSPTPIERISPDHERFELREPAGHIISIFSNHVSGDPV